MRKCYGGIDLGGTYIKAGLLSSDGSIITKFKIPTDVDLGRDKVRANLLTSGRKLTDLAKKRGYRLAGIGVGSPGTVKYPEGLITASSPNIPGWIGTNIGKLFSEFTVPVRGDNDANCMGLAESKFGVGKGSKLGFYLTIGTGIGGALVVGGSLVRGATFAAGEFGHTVFKYGGKKYKTGQRGPLEAYVAAPALVKYARSAAKKHKRSILEKNYDNLTTHTIFDAFNSGDPAAIEAITENARMIGTAIGSVVNLINPEIVVIGGGVSEGGARYIELIRNSAKSFAFDSATKGLKIKAARFGNEAGWIGAACLNM
ncbi:MAG: ROK family protein [candidate division Zixibacteria bacterium]